MADKTISSTAGNANIKPFCIHTDIIDTTINTILALGISPARSIINFFSSHNIANRKVSDFCEFKHVINFRGVDLLIVPNARLIRLHDWLVKRYTYKSLAHQPNDYSSLKGMFRHILH